MSEVKIVADSRLEAIMRLRSQLGPDAVIIDERRVPAHGLAGLLGRTVYEVTAVPATPAQTASEQHGEAASSQKPDNPETVEPGVEQTAISDRPEDLRSRIPNMESLRREIEELRSTVENLSAKGAVIMAPAPPNTARDAWRALGVESAYLGPLADRIPSKDVLVSLFPTAPEPTPGPNTQTVVAFVGPPGAGKTSLVWRAANRLSASATVGILKLVWGAPEITEPACAADPRGLRFETARGPEEALQALERLQSCEILLVDTDSFSPSEGVPFEETRLALGEIRADCVMVLSATTKPSDALRFVEMGMSMGVDRIAYTQLDLAGDMSTLIAVGARWGLPIVYLSEGPGTEHLRQGDPELLVDRVQATVSR